ncbi:MAG: hypothetical protein Q4F63_07690 [Clostridia bacterium]|nr:hypothetical protein [Clostridia bacterium]
MSMYFNIGSIVFMIISWAIPVVLMWRTEKIYIKSPSAYHISSMLFCCGALLLQFLEINYRVVKRDWSALMDTMDTLIWIIVITMFISIIFNIFAARIFYGKK